MRNAKRTILIITLICAVMVPVCLARSRRGKAKPVRMSILEILDECTETQKKLQSFIIKTQAETKGIVNKKKATTKVTSEFRFDETALVYVITLLYTINHPIIVNSGMVIHGTITFAEEINQDVWLLQEREMKSEKNNVFPRVINW